MVNQRASTPSERASGITLRSISATPTAHKGRVDICPAFPLNGGGKSLERIDPFLANIGLVFVNRQERFWRVFFQHGRPVTHGVCPYDRSGSYDKYMRFSRKKSFSLVTCICCSHTMRNGADQKIWRYTKSQLGRVVNRGNRGGLMLRPQKVHHRLYGVERTARHFHKDCIPVRHRTVPQPPVIRGPAENVVF